MSIIINYSPQDKAFVDQLVIQLSYRHMAFCIELYEFTDAAALLERIKKSDDGSCALLVIISKASLTLKRGDELLPANLHTELEKKHAVVIPVIFENCDAPEFMFANFYTDCNAGLDHIAKGLSMLTNPPSPAYRTEIRH